MKLRLLLWEDCPRNCQGCCNNDWDLQNLIVCADYSKYDLIMLTGGEPMLDPLLVVSTTQKIRQLNPSAKVYMYTAFTDDVTLLATVLMSLDGLTVTLHDQKDVVPFHNFSTFIKNRREFDDKSLRLNVFKGIDVGHINTEQWQVKSDIEWIKDCPLPEDEEFMRLKA